MPFTAACGSSVTDFVVPEYSQAWLTVLRYSWSCVAVLGAVEKIGGAIAEYDLSGVGDEEVHEGV